MTTSLTDAMQSPSARCPSPRSDETPRYTAVEVARALGLAHDPTPEQVAIIEAPMEPLLVIAGAGSGKTETMAARVVWLVANGLVAPEEVLGLTFTRKAASELSARVERRLQTMKATGLGIDATDSAPRPSGPADRRRTGPGDPFAGRPTISTYHSYAGSIVSDFGLRVGVEPTVRLLTEAATWQLAYEAAARYDGDISDFDLSEASLTKATLNLSGELAEHLVDLADVDDYMGRCIATLEAIPVVGPARLLPAEIRTAIASMRARQVAVQVARRYADLKKARDAMDFADQIALAARLARQFPDIAAIEQQRYRVVLLDEFQDTSHAQLELLRSLFSGTSVTAVGDPHQSIYGWRGASATTLAAFQSAFARGSRPVPVLPLARSWRNSQRVLDVANAVSEPLQERLTVPVERLGARPHAPTGRVFAARYLTDREEAEAVATWLADRGAGTDAASAAVLCRKRRQFRPMMEALEAQGVPFEVVGLGGLLLTPEVEDVVALLNVVADPTRGDHLMRLLLGPLVRIGAADLDGLWTYARARQRIHPPPGEGAVVDQAHDVADTATLAEAIEDPPAAGWLGPRGETVSSIALERLASLAAMIREVRALTAAPLPEVVGAAEQALGLDVEVAARPGYYLSAARAHLDAFVDVAAQFHASADRISLGAFLAWLDAAEEHERGLETRAADSAAGTVSIMTIHAAKGLEWDLVVVPGLVEATFPTHSCSQSSGKSGRWVVGPQTGKGWLGSVTDAGIPHALRGDGAALPDLDWASLRDSVECKEAWRAFALAMGEHAMDEERRLAYVAFTRAKDQLLLTSSVWGPQQSPRVTSRFLIDALGGAGLLAADPQEWWSQLDEGRLPVGAADVPVTVSRWEPMPPVEEFAKPESTTERATTWPSQRTESAARDSREGAAQAVLRAATHDAWSDVPADDPVRILTERVMRQQSDDRRPASRGPALEAISASGVVTAARSPRAFTAALRRPMPARPNRAARRGTRFHAFVEQHFGHAAMLDWDELPGSADDDTLGAEAADLAVMKAHFLGSEWADRIPVAIETAVETVLPTAHGPVSVRGRIDAVFERGEGRVAIVDWKSGGPGAPEDLDARAIQLGIYALAWERIHALAPGSVDVAFYFAATGETVWPQVPSEREIIAVLDAIGD